jgi:hypothetical protein
LERINTGQCNEACRYELLDDSIKLRALVSVLVDNAMAITHHLKQVSLLLVDTPSRLQQSEAELAIAHRAFENLGQMNVKFPKVLLSGFKRIGGTPAFEAKLNEWITTRTSTPMRNVTLRYQASEHGWAAADFHRTCDNIPRLLLIVRSTSGYVFGAFTLVGFGGSNDSHKSDENAFLFTLINPHNIAATMLPSKGSSDALYQNHYYGATFGGGFDLHISNNSNMATGSYSNPDNSYRTRLAKAPLCSVARGSLARSLRSSHSAFE